jgi:hypothetical protein
MGHIDPFHGKVFKTILFGKEWQLASIYSWVADINWCKLF